MFKRPTPLLLILTMTLLLLPLASASAKKPKMVKHQAYVVEFACGTSDSGVEGEVDVTYATSITVANLHEEPALTRMRVNRTGPEPATSDVVEQLVPAGGARRFDCTSIVDGLFTMGESDEGDLGVVHGLLVIKSRSRLHVVARNTAVSESGSVAIDISEIAGTTLEHRRKKTDEEQTVEICHVPPGNPSNRHTISVGRPAVGAHLGHGDTEGACAD